MNAPKNRQPLSNGFLVLIFSIVAISIISAMLLPTRGGAVWSKKVITRNELVRMGHVLEQSSLTNRFTNSFVLETNGSIVAGILFFRTNDFAVRADRTNSKGEFLDIYDTPYRVEITVQTNFVIRSAGGDRVFGSKDDLIYDGSEGRIVKP